MPLGRVTERELRSAYVCSYLLHLRGNSKGALLMARKAYEEGGPVVRLGRFRVGTAMATDVINLLRKWVAEDKMGEN